MQFLGYLKVKGEEKPSAGLSPLEPVLHLGLGDRHSDFFRLASKLSILMKLIVKARSGDPETTLNYAAIGSDCCETSCDILRPLYIHIPLQHVIEFCLLSLLCALSHLPMLSSFLFPLTPQLVMVHGCPSPSLVLLEVSSC